MDRRAAEERGSQQEQQIRRKLEAARMVHQMRGVQLTQGRVHEWQPTDIVCQGQQPDGVPSDLRGGFESLLRSQMERENGMYSSDGTVLEGGGRSEDESGKGGSGRRRSSSIWSKKEAAQIKRINTILESLGTLSIADDDEASPLLGYDTQSPVKRARGSDAKRAQTDRFNGSSDEITAQRIDEQSDEGSSQGSEQDQRAGSKKRKGKNNKKRQLDDEERQGRRGMSKSIKQPGKGQKLGGQPRNSSKSMKGTKDQVLGRSFKSSTGRGSQDSKELQDLVEKAIEQREGSRPMLLFDPKAEAAALAAGGTDALHAQRSHLIDHLVRERQYKLAKEMGARLSQVLSSAEFRRANENVLSPDRASATEGQVRDSVEPVRADFLSVTHSRSKTGQDSQELVRRSSTRKEKPQLSAGGSEKQKGKSDVDDGPIMEMNYTEPVQETEAPGEHVDGVPQGIVHESPPHQGHKVETMQPPAPKAPPARPSEPRVSQEKPKKEPAVAKETPLDQILRQSRQSMELKRKAADAVRASKQSLLSQQLQQVVAQSQERSTPEEESIREAKQPSAVESEPADQAKDTREEMPVEEPEQQEQEQRPLLTEQPAQVSPPSMQQKAKGLRDSAPVDPRIEVPRFCTEPNGSVEAEAPLAAGKSFADLQAEVVPEHAEFVMDEPMRESKESSLRAPRPDQGEGPSSMPETGRASPLQPTHAQEKQPPATAVKEHEEPARQPTPSESPRNSSSDVTEPRRQPSPPALNERRPSTAKAALPNPERRSKNSKISKKTPSIRVSLKKSMDLNKPADKSARASKNFDVARQYSSIDKQLPQPERNSGTNPVLRQSVQMAHTDLVHQGSSPHRSEKKVPSERPQLLRQSTALRRSRRTPSQREATSPVLRTSLRHSNEKRNEELSRSLERSKRHLEEARRDNEASEAGQNLTRLSKTLLEGQKSPSSPERRPEADSKLLVKSIVGLQQKKIDEMKQMEQMLDREEATVKDVPGGVVLPEGTRLEAASPSPSRDRLPQIPQQVAPLVAKGGNSQRRYAAEASVEGKISERVSPSPQPVQQLMPSPKRPLAEDGGPKLLSRPPQEQTANAGDLLFQDNSQSIARSAQPVPEVKPEPPSPLVAELPQATEARRSLVDRQHELLKILNSERTGDSASQQKKGQATARSVAEPAPRAAGTAAEVEAPPQGLGNGQKAINRLEEYDSVLLMGSREDSGPRPAGRPDRQDQGKKAEAGNKNAATDRLLNHSYLYRKEERVGQDLKKKKEPTIVVRDHREAANEDLRTAQGQRVNFAKEARTNRAGPTRANQRGATLDQAVTGKQKAGPNEAGGPTGTFHGRKKSNASQGLRATMSNRFLSKDASASPTVPKLPNINQQTKQAQKKRPFVSPSPGTHRTNNPQSSASKADAPPYLRHLKGPRNSKPKESHTGFGSKRSLGKKKGSKSSAFKMQYEDVKSRRKLLDNYDISLMREGGSQLSQIGQGLQAMGGPGSGVKAEASAKIHEALEESLRKAEGAHGDREAQASPEGDEERKDTTALGAMRSQLTVIQEDQSVSQSQDLAAAGKAATNGEGIHVNVSSVRQILHQMRKYSRGVKDIIETGQTTQGPPGPILNEQTPEEASKMLTDWLKSVDVKNPGAPAGSGAKQPARDDYKKKREAFIPQMESHNDLNMLKLRESLQKEGKGGPIPEEQPASNSGTSKQRSGDKNEEGISQLRPSRIGEIAQAFVREAQQEHDRSVRLQEHEQTLGKAMRQSKRETAGYLERTSEISEGSDFRLFKLNQRGERIENRDHSTAEMVRKLQMQQTNSRRVSGRREAEASSDAKHSLESSAPFLTSGPAQSRTKRPVLLTQKAGGGQVGAARGLDHLSSMSDDSHLAEGEDEGDRHGPTSYQFGMGTKTVYSSRKHKQLPGAQQSAADNLAARLQRMESVQQFVPTGSGPGPVKGPKASSGPDFVTMFRSPPPESLYPPDVLPHVLKIEAFFRMVRERLRFKRSKRAVKTIRDAWRRHGKAYMAKRGGWMRARRLVKALQSWDHKAALQQARDDREQARVWLKQFLALTGEELTELRLFQRERAKKIFELPSPSRQPRKSLESKHGSQGTSSATEQNVRVEYEEAFRVRKRGERPPSSDIHKKPEEPPADAFSVEVADQSRAEEKDAAAKKVPSETVQLSKGAAGAFHVPGEPKKKGKDRKKPGQTEGASETERSVGAQKRRAGEDSEVTSIKLGSIATNTKQGAEDAEAAADADAYNLGFARTLPGNFAQTDTSGTKRAIVQAAGPDQVYNIELRLSPGKKALGEPAFDVKVVSMRPVGFGQPAGGPADYRALQAKMQKDGMSYPVPPLVEQLLEGTGRLFGERGHISIEDGGLRRPHAFNEDLALGYQGLPNIGGASPRSSRKKLKKSRSKSKSKSKTKKKGSPARRSMVKAKMSDWYDPNSEGEQGGADMLPTLSNPKKIARPRRTKAGVRDSSQRESGNFSTLQPPSPPKRAPFPIPPGVRLSPKLSKKADTYLQSLARSSYRQGSESPPKDGRTPTEGLQLAPGVRLSVDARRKATQARLTRELMSKFANQRTSAQRLKKPQVDQEREGRQAVGAGGYHSTLRKSMGKREMPSLISGGPRALPARQQSLLAQPSSSSFHMPMLQNYNSPEAANRKGSKAGKMNPDELERLFQNQQREAHLQLAQTQLHLARAQQAEYEARLHHLSDSTSPSALAPQQAMTSATTLPQIVPRNKKQTL